MKRKTKMLFKKVNVTILLVGKQSTCTGNTLANVSKRAQVRLFGLVAMLPQQRVLDLLLQVGPQLTSLDLAIGDHLCQRESLKLSSQTEALQKLLTMCWRLWPTYQRSAVVWRPPGPAWWCPSQCMFWAPSSCATRAWPHEACSSARHPSPPSPQTWSIWTEGQKTGIGCIYSRGTPCQWTSKPQCFATEWVLCSVLNLSQLKQEYGMYDGVEIIIIKKKH